MPVNVEGEVFYCDFFYGVEGIGIVEIEGIITYFFCTGDDAKVFP